jgi:hypothetical protein
MDVATNPVIDLCEQRTVLLAVVEAVVPGRVACLAPGPRFTALLGDWAAEVGFQVVGDPGAADLVISAARDYRSVHDLLTVAARRGATAVVAGTDWPLGRRDACADLERLPEAERERFAHRLPAPGEPELTRVPSPVAFAVTEGGPRNGVRTAVEDAVTAAEDVWDVRLIAGLGGLAVLLPASLAAAGRWSAITPAEDSSRALPRLELANVQLRLERERLLEVLERHRGLDVDPCAVAAQLDVIEGLMADSLLGEGVRRSPDAGETLDLERRLTAIAGRLSWVSRRHRERVRALEAERARRAELSESLRDADFARGRQEEAMAEVAGELRDARSALAERDERLAALQRAHAQELAYIREQADRIAQSGAWRWGHRLALTRSRLLLRRTRGTDAVTRLLERVPASSARPDGAAGPALLPPAAESIGQERP